MERRGGALVLSTPTPTTEAASSPRGWPRTRAARRSGGRQGAACRWSTASVGSPAAAPPQWPRSASARRSGHRVGCCRPGRPRPARASIPSRVRPGDERQLEDAGHFAVELGHDKNWFGSASMAAKASQYACRQRVLEALAGRPERVVGEHLDDARSRPGGSRGASARPRAGPAQCTPRHRSDLAAGPWHFDRSPAPKGT